MNNNLLLYQVALTLIPNIGPVQARLLLQHFTPEQLFKAKKTTLGKIDGIGEVRAASVTSFSAFREAEQEMRFIEKYKITPLFITDPSYPQRMLNCYDSPTLLYYRGSADLNCSRVIAIIGSRTHTEYGRQLTDTLVRELAMQEVLIVSGLAYGIDAVAHRAATKNELPTVGVLAHGLDQIYPQQHASLAKEMIQHGGLLTEFRSHTKPDKHNFPIRNRIVAGISDATIVIETGVKGGSMITAELANGYNKDVFAFPGRVTDAKSAGCNYLIKNNKAALLTNAAELTAMMGWEEKKFSGKRIQKELFVELTENEKVILAMVEKKESVHIDELNIGSGLSSSAVAAAILNLELQNIIRSRPGKLYCLA